MDTLIYLKSVADLAVFDEFELASSTVEVSTTYTVFGIAGDQREPLGEFVTHRYAVLFVELCESARCLSLNMASVRAEGGSRHAPL